MPSLACYRIVEELDGASITNFDDAVDLESFEGTVYGPIQGNNFTAQLYVVDTMPHVARWANFLRQGFGGALNLRRITSPAALLLVRVRVRRRDVIFGLPFGAAGRFLLKPGSFRRGYGLRTALNIVYQRGASTDVARLRAVDSKRRGPTTMRSRSQVSEASTFETFDINRLRDVVNQATGIPVHQEVWGRRITGGDALNLGLKLEFDQLGQLCRRVEAAHRRDDYRDDFDWIDYIQPVTDPALREQLEDEVLDRLQTRNGDGLELAPPEIVDWEIVSSFHYHVDPGRRRNTAAVTHPDLRLADYLRGLQREGQLDDLNADFLRTRRIDALEGGGELVRRWTAWKCLVGEFSMGGASYILDEGDFFAVRADYLAELDSYINAIPESSFSMPPAPRTQHEDEYNRSVAAASESVVLLDRRTITIPGRTTPVELCDLLTRDRQLVHVKRHLGSSDLSHLFAQGFVSAELLQMNAQFRELANARVEECSAGSPGFEFFVASGLVPRDFEIVYAIVANWQGRNAAEGLPFFSKVNLREVATSLRSRDFRVGLNRVDTY